MPGVIDPGIYQITVLAEGGPRYYIGRATRLTTRRNEHFRRLDENRHQNRFLQRCWDKYGASSFLFSVLTRCKKEDLGRLEQQELDRAISKYGEGRILNILRDCASSRINVSHTDKCKEKLRAKMKALWMDPKYRDRQLRKINAGRRTNEGRKNNSEAQKIAQNREAVRLKKSEIARLQGHDPITKAKRRAANARPDVRLRRSIAVKAALAARK